MKIVADAQIPCIEDYFGLYGDLVLLEGRNISSDDVHDADILIVRSVTKVNESLLRKSNVRYVGSVTAGADHLDTKWFDKVGIAWNVATGFNAPPVADYIVSVIASLPELPKRAAVIGIGNVGRLVVNDLQLLNIAVIQCDPIRAQAEPDFPHTPLNAISDCDLILLHVPLTFSGAHPTFHFINQAFLEQQKPGALLVNACRGAVIDTIDLMKFGSHLKWCLDVWENEPKFDKKLLEQAMIATPHIAGYSVQSKVRGIDMIYRLACERDIIQPLPFVPHIMRDQVLQLSHAQTWQEVILSIFNPLEITQQMKKNLLPAENYGELFDEMRNQFNYRHEFKATKILTDKLPTNDRLLLKKLGIKY